MPITPNQKIKGLVQLIRPELPFAAGVCVVLGEVVALGGFPSLRDTVPGFLCGFFISASSIVLNDYFDLEVDKMNTPNRPLAAGIVLPFEAIARDLPGRVVRRAHFHPGSGLSMKKMEHGSTIM